jgi:hemerythrin-like metal-binding protein
MPICWNSDYELGIAHIDAQHHQFIDNLNELYQAITEVPLLEKVMPIFGKIEDYTVYHFRTEEDFFKKVNYPQSAGHIAQHNEFKVKVAELKAKLQTDGIGTCFELVDYLENWLVEHISHYDRLYAPYFDKTISK